MTDEGLALALGGPDTHFLQDRREPLWATVVARAEEENKIVARTLSTP